jgi:hypothetical protein
MISGSGSDSSSSSIVRKESVSDDLDSDGLREPYSAVSSHMDSFAEEGLRRTSECEFSIQALILRENSRLRRNCVRARRCSDVSTKGCRRPLLSYWTVLLLAHGE